MHRLVGKEKNLKISMIVVFYLESAQKLQMQLGQPDTNCSSFPVSFDEGLSGSYLSIISLEQFGTSSATELNML